jgi:hypothetical protein
MIHAQEVLRVTPTMEAGVANHVWTYEKVIGIVNAYTPKPGPRGPYKKHRNSI